MAIAPLSPVSSLAQILGASRVNPLGPSSKLPPVEAIRPVVYEGPAEEEGRGTRGGEASEAAVTGGSAGSLPAQPAPFDRRSASALIDGAATGGRGEPADKEEAKPWELPRPSDSEVRDRLSALQGEKARVEGDRRGEVAERSSEVTDAVAQLKARDGEVRAHESAHVSAGGRYITGGASFTYQKGPDGIQYAIGGEVGIDSSPVSGKPAETLAKMRVVRAAALAPAEPSGADLAVAAAASQAEASAVTALANERAREAAKALGQGAEDQAAPDAAMDGTAAVHGSRDRGSELSLAYDRGNNPLPGASLDLVA